jgi:hypothetical protein
VRIRNKEKDRQVSAGRDPGVPTSRIHVDVLDAGVHGTAGLNYCGWSIDVGLRRDLRAPLTWLNWDACVDESGCYALWMWGWVFRGRVLLLMKYRIPLFRSSTVVEDCYLIYAST